MRKRAQQRQVGTRTSLPSIAPERGSSLTAAAPRVSFWRAARLRQVVQGRGGREREEGDAGGRRGGQSGGSGKEAAESGAAAGGPKVKPIVEGGERGLECLRNCVGVRAFDPNTFTHSRVSTQRWCAHSARYSMKHILR